MAYRKMDREDRVKFWILLGVVVVTYILEFATRGSYNKLSMALIEFFCGMIIGRAYWWKTSHEKELREALEAVRDAFGAGQMSEVTGLLMPKVWKALKNAGYYDPKS